MMETDWERWGDITPPTSWVNDWNEPYSEIYDWYPWMRKFYSRLEIEKDCITVRGDVWASLLRTKARLTCWGLVAFYCFMSRLPEAISTCLFAPSAPPQEATAERQGTVGAGRLLMKCKTAASLPSVHQSRFENMW